MAHDLAIEADLGLFGGTDEFAVAGASGLNGGADAGLPQGAHVALFEAPVVVSVLAGFEGGDGGKFDLALSTPHEALSELKEVPAALVVHCAAFYTSHMVRSGS